MHASILALLIGIALVIAWYLDNRSWKKKPREELLQLLCSKDWRYHPAALKELQRRGEDTTIHIPQLVASLVAESKVERCAAFVTLQNCFPDIAAEIKGFTGTATVSVCRAQAGALLSRYGITT